MSKFKGILIDPEKREVTDVVWDDEDFDALYTMLGISTLDHTPSVVYFDRVIKAWVDDMGLSKPELYTFVCPSIYPLPLAGRALVWAAERNGENTLDVPFDAEVIKNNIIWGPKLGDSKFAPIAAT